LLPGLKHLPDLRQLVCQFAHGHGNIEYIDDVPALLVLDVFDPALHNIDSVAGHPRLGSLHMNSHQPDVDLSPVSRSRSLYEVALCHANRFGAELRHLSAVRHLSFRDVIDFDLVLPHIAEGVPLRLAYFLEAWPVTELGPLLACPRMAELEFLMLRRAEQLTSIAGIERWAATMKSVYLGAPVLADVERLATLPLLEFANLRHMPIRSLDFTSGLSKLNRLHIGKAGYRHPDLAPLCELPALRDLHLWGDQAIDLSHLADAADLTVHVGGVPSRYVHNRPESVTVKMVKGNG
jgi:hypothetical protein